jgi:phospholipase/carboxylesterase
MFIDKYQLDYIEKDTRSDQNPEYVVIWLHGLGADCNDFVPIVNEIKLDVCVKFVFPNAPVMPITINNGHAMRSWYDIYSLTNIDNMIDKNGLKLSVNLVDDLIQYYVKNGYQTTDIILAGFSQGGSVIYQALSSLNYKIRGAVILSSYMVDPNNFVINTINKNASILVCHGKLDDVVSYELGLSSYNVLHKNGYHALWMQYLIGHSVSKDLIHDLESWFNDLLVKKEFKKAIHSH